MPDHNPLKTMADATKAWADFVAYLGLSRAAADPEQRYRMTLMSGDSKYFLYNLLMKRN